MRRSIPGGRLISDKHITFLEFLSWQGLKLKIRPSTMKFMLETMPMYGQIQLAQENSLYQVILNAT
jgi:hypothetical protein